MIKIHALSKMHSSLMPSPGGVEHRTVLLVADRQSIDGKTLPLFDKLPSEQRPHMATVT